MRKIAALVLAAAVSFSAVGMGGTARAETVFDGENTPETGFFSIAQTQSSYDNYLSQNADADFSKKTISVNINEFTTRGNAKCAVSTAADTMGKLSWQGTGDVSWDFKVEEAGLYCLEMNYFSKSENNSFISFGILIDGEYPFDEAREVKFYRYWRNKTSIRLDENYQNQVLPDLVRYNCDINAFARQSSVSDEPLKFYLSSGEHTLTLSGVSTDFFIGSLRFSAESEPVSYSEIRPSEEKLSQTPALIDQTPVKIEAEMPKYTNSAALRPTSEPSDYTASPSHPTYTRYNTIGAESWNTAGQTLFYEVNVPADGYYALNIKCRLGGGSGVSAYRRIAVNGASVCKELDEVEILYSPDWEVISPQTENQEPIFIRLGAGKNIISIEAINGKSGAALRSFGAALSLIQNDVDQGREIDFGEYREKLASARAELESASGKSLVASETDVLLNLLKKYEQKEPSDLSDLRKCLNSVWEWLEKCEKRSVEMDYIELRTVHEEFRDISRDFFKQLGFSLEKFFGSFFSDNSAKDSETSGLSVYVEKSDFDAINALSADFSDSISVYSGSGGLLEAALSGNAPDVALFVDTEEICELASRGLIVDVSAFSGFNELNDRFISGAAQMYDLNGGVYGVPLTASFPMMFCRTDILSALGLSVPESWDELENALSVLNKNGLTAGLGAADEFSEENAFMIMLSQCGTDLKSGAPDFASDEVKSAFSRYVDFYGEYGCPREYDALRMFKAGTMPIVIADYAEFYGKLSNESELYGRWGVYHVPGTRRTDRNGSLALDYSAGASSTGAVIFANSENIAQAWEFIKQFSETQTQTAFGVMKEAASADKLYAAAVLETVYALRQSPVAYRNISAQALHINALPESEKKRLIMRAAQSASAEAAGGKITAKDAIERYGGAVNAKFPADKT